MKVVVNFYSYFKDLTGCAQTIVDVPEGSTLGELLQSMISTFPALAAMQKSTLIAVNVDYQPRSYVLRQGEEVSLFPPVQGG